jgi:aminopeptidase YwaD
VLTAHVDSKDGTPGALDDGSGIVTLLLLAELLRDYAGQLGIEIAVLNGEDHYSAAGEVHYLKSNLDKFGEILLCVNLDDLGYHQGHTAYSLYNCPDAIATLILQTFSRHTDLIEGEPWYQGDHMIFVQNRVPALATTSERMMEILTSIAHTAKDTPDIVDCAKLANTAVALQEVVAELDNRQSAIENPKLPDAHPFR